MGYRADTTFLDVPRPTISRILSGPFRLQTYLNILYLLLAFPLGIGYFVFLITGASVAGSLFIFLVGFPLGVAVLVISHGLAGFERVIARHLLSIEVPSPGYPFLETTGILNRLNALVLNLDTYKAMGYLLSKFFLGVGMFVFITVMFSVSITLMLTPFYYDRDTVDVGLTVGEPITLTPSVQIPWGDLLIGLEVAFAIANVEIATLGQALVLSALGVIVLVISCAFCNAIAWVVGRYTQVFLGAPREEQRGSGPREHDGDDEWLEEPTG